MFPNTFRPTLFARLTTVSATLLSMLDLSLQATPAHAHDVEITAVQTTVLEIVSGDTLIVDAGDNTLPDPDGDGRTPIHLANITDSWSVLDAIGPTCRTRESTAHLMQLLYPHRQVIIDTETMRSSPWPMEHINHATVITLNLDDLGYQQVADGYARVSVSNDSPEDYLDAQDLARQSDAGLWAGCPAS